MGETTAIQWADKTFNPWWGCTKVAPPCDHCYAETFDRRVGGDHWGPGKPRRLIKDWSGPAKWDREAKERGKPFWVFCASMADVFDNEVEPAWRTRLWDLVRECRNLNWQFVTKRIGNAAKMLPPDWAENFRHCGIMISVGGQDEANRDVPKLLALKASHKVAWVGVSAEPLLEPIQFDDIEVPDKVGTWHFDALSDDGSGEDDPFRGAHLDWIIVGGESGPGARPMHPGWARSIRDQCAAAGVPFFYKQTGEWAPMPDSYADARYSLPLRVWVDGAWTDCGGAEGEWLARVGKKAAGRLLDGIEHNAMPAPRP